MNSADRPLVLVDLDDTLFQTARKMASTETLRYPASYDINGAISGYQSAVQKSLLDWLLRSADVVPVTARSAEAFGRVRLGFSGGAICCHGGLILRSDGKVDDHWLAVMTDKLSGYRERLPLLCEAALDVGARNGFSLRAWVVEETGQRYYVVVKHSGARDADLSVVAAQLQATGVLGGMHLHCNGNNLALLPLGLSKRAAVEHYLRADFAAHGERPVLGFGDSITDLGFMNLCHFWSTPAVSQLASLVEGAAHA